MIHQRHSILGPLVLKYNSDNFLTFTADRDRTVSRRSEPNSCSTLIGEQPNPWDLLQPQDVKSRHRGANQSCRYELSRIISLLSLAYLLSIGDDLSIQNHRITMTNFRYCSISKSHSKADLCHYTLQKAKTFLSLPLYTSVTILEETAPVKLPIINFFLIKIKN